MDLEFDNVKLPQKPDVLVRAYIINQFAPKKALITIHRWLPVKIGKRKQEIDLKKCDVSSIIKCIENECKYSKKLKKHINKLQKPRNESSHPSDDNMEKLLNNFENLIIEFLYLITEAIEKTGIYARKNPNEIESEIQKQQEWFKGVLEASKFEVKTRVNKKSESTSVAEYPSSVTIDNEMLNEVNDIHPDTCKIGNNANSVSLMELVEDEVSHPEEVSVESFFEN